MFVSDPQLSQDDLEQLRDELETFHGLWLLERNDDGTYRPSPFMQRVVDVYSLAKRSRLLDDR